MLDLNKIVQVDFPENQYYKQETSKNQIVIHHTVSDNVTSVIEWWKQKPERVATHVIIDKDGTIYQLYSSKYWAHHLGMKTSNNEELNKHSLAIELVNWGADAPKHNCKELTHYPSGFRGYKIYETYSKKQLESMRDLIVYWSNKYNIPVKYNDSIWNVNQDAISGKSGLYTHVSYRSDKSDCHPDVNLINILKTL